MQIKVSSFSKFLELINLSGEVEIKTCIFRGDKDKLSITAVDEAKKVVVAHGEYDGDFSSIGVIGIEDLTLLRRMMSAFAGDVEMTKTTNKLKLSNGKKLNVELILRNAQYVLNEVDKAKYDVLHTKAIGNAFTIDDASVKEFENYYKIFGKEVFISGANNEISFGVDNGNNSLNLSIAVKEAVKKFEIKLAGFLMIVLGAVKNNPFTMSINGGTTPILLSTKTDEFKVDYIVAPLVK